MTSVIGSFRRAREWAYPQLTKSAFLDKGVLTPDEFVIAGDELVYRCPTWSWEGGDPTKVRPYLPPHKQYLVTRNVPCQNRVSSLEQNLKMESEGFGDGDGGDGFDGDGDDWLVSSIIRQATGDDDDEGGGEDDNNGHLDDDDDDDFDILDADGEVVEKVERESVAVVVPTTGTGTGADTGGGDNNVVDDDEYADMADYEDDNVLMDEDVAVQMTPDGQATTAGTAAGGSSSSNNNNNTALLRVRTYDVSITYDKYYQTPRVWMTGRDPHDQPLTAAQTMEDVISDYAYKTVTMESHPHVSGPQASIHPCQHSKVMKAIVRNLIKATTETKGGDNTGGQQQQQQVVVLDGDEVAQQSAVAAAATATSQGPSVEMYLFIFLKFVSSMIPTINYDFTMDVTADTSK